MKNIIANPLISAKDMVAFKKGKLELMKEYYPLEKAHNFTMLFLQKSKNTIKNEIKGDALLLTAPSGTRLNLIPFIAAKIISKELKNVEVLSGDKVANPKYQFQAKSRKFSHDKAKIKSEIIDFDIRDAKKITQIANGRKIFIMEDWIDTGETAINFKRRLEQKGVKIEGIASLISNDKYMVSENDIKEASKVLKENIREKYHKKVDSVTRDFLQGYTKGKYLKLLMTIDELPGKENEVFKGIEKITNNYKKLGLLEETKQEKDINLSTEEYTINEDKRDYPDNMKGYEIM